MFCVCVLCYSSFFFVVHVSKKIIIWIGGLVGGVNPSFSRIF